MSYHAPPELETNNSSSAEVALCVLRKKIACQTSAVSMFCGVLHAAPNSLLRKFSNSVKTLLFVEFNFKHVGVSAFRLLRSYSAILSARLGSSLIVFHNSFGGGSENSQAVYATSTMW